MDAESAIQVGRQALMLVLLISSLPLVAALLVGLVVSIFQAATQIQEQHLTTVPRMVAVYAVLAVGGLWMLQQLSSFAISMMQAAGNVGP